MANVVTPYKEESSKKQQVQRMFDSIAGRYDFLNQLLSLGIHNSWRKKAVAEFIQDKPQRVLDLATGTGDFAIAALKAKPKEVIGADISEGMLEVGRKKLQKLDLDKWIQLQAGDAETLDFPNDYFDVITVGFGVRNYENLEKGLANMLRMLKPGGKVVILEFSKPNGWFKVPYGFYFNYLTPLIGKLFSSDKRAYAYLNESVQAFPEREALLAIMQRMGYDSLRYKALTYGVACIYVGSKPKS